jgi:4-carboxymuconolactone decarboxylase
MARMPLVALDASPEVAAAYAEIAQSRGRVLNVFRAFGHAPEGLRRLAAVGEYVRFRAELPVRLRELTILAAAAVNRCQYEWTQHAPLATAAGVTDAELAALGAGRLPAGLAPVEQAAVGCAHELLVSRRVRDETFAELRAHLGPRQVTDLMLVVAYYTALGLMLNAFEVDLEPGQTPLLPTRGSGPGPAARLAAGGATGRRAAIRPRGRPRSGAGSSRARRSAGGGSRRRRRSRDGRSR